MTRVEVALGSRSYPIHIGAGALDNATFYRQVIHGKRVVIISTLTIAQHYLERVKAALNGYHIDTLLLDDGEAQKSVATFERVIEFLLSKHCGRDTVLIALGGGVVGDLTGFVAACYQRGIDYLQIPTTLLAQVDSSVGGKTAINHPLGKNMIGAFHQPKSVIIDSTTLATLPLRELRAGLAEVIKYGVIWDEDFFNWLERHLEDLLALEPQVTQHAVARSCSIKAKIVALDEHELSGERALLNLGHTFGHAIEAQLGFGNWLHGEAVALGMLMAVELATRTHHLSLNDAQRITQLIERSGLPTQLPCDFDVDAMVQVMHGDKKAVHGILKLVLPVGIGKANLISGVDDNQLKQVIRQYCPDQVRN